MPDQIFISYRRDDAAYVTGHINDLLRKEFGSESVFTDVDNIALGVDFRMVLDQSVSQCQVLLAVIGDKWLTVRNKDGKPRLHDPADFVRIEIESALRRDIPVIPLLVSGATMPLAEDLPDSLKDLAFRNGTQIRPAPDFGGDVNRLIRNLKLYLRSIRNGSGNEPGIHIATDTSRSEAAEEQRSSAEPAAKRDANPDRRQVPREEMLVGNAERARKQAELGFGNHPGKKRWGARLGLMGVVVLAGASWYYVDQNPQKMQAVLTAFQTQTSEVEGNPDAGAAVDRVSDAGVPGEVAGDTVTTLTANAFSAADDYLAPEADPATGPAAGIASETSDDPEINHTENAATAPDPATYDEVILTPGSRRQADASEFIREGVSLAAIGDHAAAIQNFDEAIRLEVEPAFVYSERGASYQVLGEYEAAVRDYDEAIRLNSEDVNAYYNRGASHFALEDYTAAIADYDAVIRLDPEFADAYSKRADAHEAVGNAEAAARDRSVAAVFQSQRN